MDVRRCEIKPLLASGCGYQVLLRARWIRKSATASALSCVPASEAAV
jgi:hypothetical protein